MAEIQRFFVQSGLKVGDRLPSERALASQLSIGRSSLREAIQGLQTMGFVEVRHGIGTFFISEPGKWLLGPLQFQSTPPRHLFEELMEARLLVEVRLAALAAERATADDIERIRTAAALRAGAQRGEYSERGLEFHVAVAAAAHHSVLGAMLKAVSHLHIETLKALDHASQDVEAAFRRRQHRGHDQILRMIEERNPQDAAEAMQAHLQDLLSELPTITQPSRRRQKETA